MAKSGGFTKHFFIESQRIVSKLGESSESTDFEATSSSIDYTEKVQQLNNAQQKNEEKIVAKGKHEPFVAGRSGKIPPGLLNNPPNGKGKGKGGGNDNGDNNNDGGGGNGNGNGRNSEAFQFYYHPDHLGNSSYITDASGEVYQHLEYFPFGETFIEEHSNTDRTPYLFNGKELDEETGLYYYGARYYDARTSVWQSVDPIVNKYLDGKINNGVFDNRNLNPFKYCYQNPLRYIDPTGLFDVETGEIEKGDNLTKITKQINTKFKTDLTVNDIAAANSIKDVDKIKAGDKIALPGQDIRLEFDLNSLKVVDNTYSRDMPDLEWDGTSGREGYQNKKNQKLKDKGPLPEGTYAVDPSRTQSYESLSQWDKFKGEIGRGTWPGGKESWGDFRTWLEPVEGTNTFGRSGFTIHGGDVPGSAGCIDLIENNNSFHKWLENYGKTINLRVKYE